LALLFQPMTEGALAYEHISGPHRILADRVADISAEPTPGSTEATRTLTVHDSDCQSHGLPQSVERTREYEKGTMHLFLPDLPNRL
jgi:hypothetical protein